MTEEGGYLGAMTYQCLFSPILDRLKADHMDSPQAVTSINRLRSSLQCADQTSPSFLYDVMRILLSESQLNVNLQESFLRLQKNASIEDLEIPQYPNVAEFQELSVRAIALRKVLSRVPEEMGDRRTFLETIREIASSIKKLLDATNAVIQVVPTMHQQAVERRKREFVHYSKGFSNTLKDYFRNQNANQVSVSANQLIFQTTQIVRTVRDKARLT
uniref:Programmed cell death protein 10 n=1 Tax=Steinernema glaseri TaxID=37863 RepID=A0A1I8AKQ4_9BILA